MRAGSHSVFFNPNNVQIMRLSIRGSIMPKVPVSERDVSIRRTLTREQSKEIKQMMLGRQAKETSIADLCALFWKLEEKHYLIDMSAHKVHPWPLIRMPLYYSLTRKLALFDPPHPAGTASHSSISFIRYIKFILWFKLLKFRNVKPPQDVWTPAVLLMSTRRMGTSEPCSDAVRAELGPRALLIDRPYKKDIHPGSFDTKVLRRAFTTLYHFKSESELPVSIIQKLHEVRMDFIEALGVDPGDLVRQSRKSVLDFQSMRDGMQVMCQRLGIKTMFLSHGYGSSNMAMLEGARLAGARIIELQHGIISKYHLGYSYPNRTVVPHMPDELWCFGQYWIDTTPLPSAMKTKVIGAPYVAKRALESTSPRNPNQVIFNSQGVVGRLIVDFALQTARLRKDLKVIFRLHPSENIETYKKLLSKFGSIPDNFSLSTRTPNIFALQAESGIQVGAFSTTLFEGMALGTRTICLDLPGVEYMEPAIARGDVIKVKSVEELVQEIDKAPFPRDPQVYYAIPPDRLLTSQNEGSI